MFRQISISIYELFSFKMARPPHGFTNYKYQIQNFLKSFKKSEPIFFFWQKWQANKQARLIQICKKNVKILQSRVNY